MNLFRIITAISAVSFLALSGFVYIRNRISGRNRAFALWVAFCALWSLGFFLTMFQQMPQGIALWCSRISHLFGGLTAFLFLRFVTLFLESTERIHLAHRVLAISTGLSSVSPWMIKAVVPKLFFPYYPEPGALYPVLMSAFFVTYGEAFRLLYIAFRDMQLPREKRMQAIWTLIGVVIAWLNVATLFLLIYNIPRTPQLTLFPLIAVMTVYTILRYRFLDIRIVITRAGLLLAIYLVVLGLPLAIGWCQQGVLYQQFGDRWWLVPLGLSTALATAGPFAYAFLRNQAEARLLKDQRRYQRFLERAARGMTQVRNIRKLSNLIARTVSTSVKLTHASLFLWDKVQQRYVLRASSGTKRLALRSRYGISHDHPMIQWLRVRRQVLTNDMLLQYPATGIREELGNLQASLVIPGFIQERLIGILVLGQKTSGAGYSDDDLHAFETLANEAAIAIENALSYEELLKVNEQLKAASERLLLQERLAAAGQFATGMAHEIKNPLSAIKTFAEYLPEKYKDQQFRDKFFRIVQGEIERINGIVKELSDFAKPAPLQLQPVHLAGIVEDTLSLLSNQCLSQGVDVQKSFGENGLRIEADAQQLKQVILNLLLNSLEAMEKGGALRVSIAPRGQYLVFRVSDTGTGIPPEHLQHIWDPFFTTKERGMGLGLAIVKGIIDRHGGQMTLSSRPGQGTTVELSLPLQPSK